MKIVVLGTGAWGTALAQILADNKHQVVMFGKDLNSINEINLSHTNSRFFNDLKLNDNIKATNDIQEELKNSEMIVIALPTIAIREVILGIKDLFKKGAIVVNASKGLDPISNELFCQSLPSILQDKCFVASIMGPGFAEEVIKKQLTAVNAASTNLKVAKIVQETFSNEYFRVYTTTDIVGVEIGASVKNVIAIAAGIAEGLGYRINTKAALITRGLAEIMRFGLAHDAEKMTFVGLSGVGDLILTCATTESRNYLAGYQIGQSNCAKKFLENNTITVEGIRTAKVIHDKALEKGIEMPIVESIYQILFKDKQPSLIINELMSRELKNEF